MELLNDCAQDNDLIYMKGQGIDGCKQMAILTALFGASTNLPNKIFVHELSEFGILFERHAGFRLQDG